MSRTLMVLWVVLLCRGLVLSLGTKALESGGEQKQKPSKRWWLTKKCSDDKPLGHSWSNNWDGQFRFECPAGQTISFMFAVYRDCKRDRLFEFKCHDIFASKYHYHSNDCSWTDYVNDFDGVVDYQCPEGKFLAGVESEHRNDKEDRRFKFKCCGVSRFKYRETGCFQTCLVNDWKKQLEYTVPRQHNIVGLYSEHDNGQEDRRWKLEICKVKILPEPY